MEKMEIMVIRWFGTLRFFKNFSTFHETRFNYSETDKNWKKQTGKCHKPRVCALKAAAGNNHGRRSSALLPTYINELLRPPSEACGATVALTDDSQAWSRISWSVTRPSLLIRAGVWPPGFALLHAAHALDVYCSASLPFLLLCCCAALRLRLWSHHLPRILPGLCCFDPRGGYSSPLSIWFDPEMSELVDTILDTAA